MNDTPTSDALLWEALPDLNLNIAQTAALCGISVRQLGYWTQQGYVAAQGQGARRTYGLEAVRRVLAIRKAMDGGASLRQARNQAQALVSSLEPLAAPALPPPRPAAELAAAPASALSGEEHRALTRCLRAFFERNRSVRDHAAGLAVKIGRAADDVRAVAEGLCAAGVLVQEDCHGMTIFHEARQEQSHA